MLLELELELVAVAHIFRVPVPVLGCSCPVPLARATAARPLPFRPRRLSVARDEGQGHWDIALASVKLFCELLCGCAAFIVHSRDLMKEPPSDNPLPSLWLSPVSMYMGK